MTLQCSIRRLRTALGQLYRKLKRLALRRSIPIDKTHPRRSGTLFIGYAEGMLGLGHAFRSDLDAATAAGMEFSVYPFRTNIENRLLPPYMPERYDQNHIYDINVIEIAADQLPFLYETINPDLLKDSYNVLRPYWELEKAPAAWRPFLKRIHEIWAPNSFIASSFEQIFDGPIKVIQPVVNLEDISECSRAEFGMRSNCFYFMFSFDYYSSVYRKNPLGVLEAFRLAFPRGDENAGLVVKTNGKPELYPDFVTALREAVERDERIIVVDGHLSRDKMLGLMQASDAYVSLHRAEGFGLGMAEAMGLGKIVIATDYSGNRDFLTAETGFPVPYRMRIVGSHEYAYAEGQQWAEPDVQSAADIMKEVAINSAIALERQHEGQEFIYNQYGVKTVGKRMKSYTDAIISRKNP